MFDRFMPREGKFFDLFNAHAEQIVAGGRELAALMSKIGDSVAGGATVLLKLNFGQAQG